MHGDQASSSSGGRKGRLDHNVLAYYRETLRNLDEMRSPSWGNPDDYEQLLSTAFDSLAREGRQLAQNQTGSRLAESLINLADWPRLARLLNNFATNWPAVVGDRFAHRVLQTAIRRYLTLRLEGRGEADAAGSTDDDGAVDGEPSPVESDPSRLWGTFAAHMRLHYPEYLEHPYACHTLRSYLLLIGGVLVSANPTAPSGSSFNKHDSYDPSSSVLVDPPLEFDGISLTEELDGLCSRFLENKHVLSLIDSEVTGPFLQVLMLVLKLRLPKRFRKFIKHLNKASGLLDATCEIEALGEKYSVPSLLCSSTGCYFLEQLVSLLSPKQLRKFASAHIAGKEAALALHPSANFVLQRLATADPPPGDWLAKLVASAVGDSPGAGWLSEAMRQSPGRQQQLLVVLARQCRAAQPLPQDEARRLQAQLMRKFDSIAASSCKSADSSSALFDTVAAVGAGADGGVGVAGGQLLEELLRFADTKLLCTSLMHSQPLRLALLCRCPRGNRVFEACLSSSTVPADIKLGLCDRLLDNLAELSCDKHGSRVLDAFWAVGDHRLRERVARQLAAGGRAALERLRLDRFGRFACQKFAPELLAARPGDWKRLQQRLDEAQKQKQKQQDQPKRPREDVTAAEAEDSQQPKSKKRHKMWPNKQKKPPAKSQ
ncbi:hypothetical protein BOX15_Mlig030877g2 [Macrostomum lignano]|uniref:Nucleolar protein 9 n=2 Tax=Macrostomum lignano TaxID=282301 RepID=A0A1I8J7Z1_9PLAT|nr:hypothetical protein BOX15_Mlig030877g2 [Macrostomum lignano]